MLEKRSRPAVVVFQGKLVVLGGYNNENGSLDSVEEYDPALQRWRQLPRMCEPRIGCKVVVLDGELVVTGGFKTTGERGEYLEVERYSPARERWQPIASLCCTPNDPFPAVLTIQRVRFLTWCDTHRE